MLKTHQNIILLLLLFPLTVFSQPSLFYEHYTGLISDELKVTADLINREDSFSGYYYYKFKEDGAWKASKPIALDGHISSDNSFVLNEFGKGHSFFNGILESSKLIKGEWVNEMLENPIAFTFKATYSKESIPMRVIENREIQHFNGNISSPTANYYLSGLLPSSVLDKAVYHQLNKRIYYLMGYRGELSKDATVIASLKEMYFKQFNSSLENIKLDSFPDQFNWEKSIRMDVINNEGGLLCLQVETYAKTGVKEGAKVNKYLVFNVIENEVIKLEDLLSEEKQVLLNELIQEQLRLHYRIKPETSLSEAGFFQNEIPTSKNFYLHPGGLGFYYNIYEIAPFSNGPTNLFIPWEKLNGIIEPML